MDNGLFAGVQPKDGILVGAHGFVRHVDNVLLDHGKRRLVLDALGHRKSVGKKQNAENFGLRFADRHLVEKIGPKRY